MRFSASRFVQSSVTLFFFTQGLRQPLHPAPRAPNALIFVAFKNTNAANRSRRCAATFPSMEMSRIFLMPLRAFKARDGLQPRVKAESVISTGQKY